jgi:hypothetical protein
MAATLDAGPSASLAREKRHTGCAQNFSQMSDTACLSPIQLGAFERAYFKVGA